MEKPCSQIATLFLHDLKPSSALLCCNFSLLNCLLCISNTLWVKYIKWSNVRMAHCKSLIGHFPGCYLCSVAWREIKYSDVLSCLSVWCVSAESLSSQQDVRCGVGHKKALELVHLHQREEINAFPSKRFTTEPSTRINSGEKALSALARSYSQWPQIDTDTLYVL